MNAQFTRPEQIANCLACTLGLKDCPACYFAPAVTRASDADVYRMWKRLWGERTPEQVTWYSDLMDSEQYDQTQLTDNEIAEMEKE